MLLEKSVGEGEDGQRLRPILGCVEWTKTPGERHFLYCRKIPGYMCGCYNLVQLATSLWFFYLVDFSQGSMARGNQSASYLTQFSAQTRFARSPSVMRFGVEKHGSPGHGRNAHGGSRHRLRGLDSLFGCGRT